MKQREACVTFPLAVFILLSMTLTVAEIPNLFPGDTAPPFVLQSTKGLLKFNSTNSTFKLQPPIVFLAFSNNSGFMEQLIDNPDSIESLIHLSPENTQYVFMFNERSKEYAENLNKMFFNILKRYHPECRGFGTPGNLPTTRPASGVSISPYFGTPGNRPTGGHRTRKPTLRRQAGSPYFGTPGNRPTRGHRTRKPTLCRQAGTVKQFTDQWMKRVHFITFPVTEFGNWIPRVLSQWYCSGHGCGLDQLVIENKHGDISKISKRLDARYDWLPSPDSLPAKFGHLNFVYIGDACSPDISANVSGKLALVSSEGHCSYFRKVLNSQKNGAVGVVVINKRHRTTLQDMNCVGNECYTQLSIPATMIPYETGRILKTLSTDWFARFQTTPFNNFFFGIDGQGKLQETGLFLFPSMRFMAYQAQWFNYEAEMLHNLTGSARIINIFNQTDMSGKGANYATVEIPSLNELQQYEYVELDMSLRCPENRDDTCQNLCHVVQVLVCCGQELCGEELGRWITAFKRPIGHWLTPVKSLIPLLSSGNAGSTSKCIFKVSNASLAVPWIVTLNIRLAGKLQAQNALVPFKIEPLYRGGRFDKKYNTKYRPITFTPPADCKRVELVAAITGRGSDKNKCAEFCVTSHHFVINSTINCHHNNSRVFKNAGTAMGCAEREGMVPNQYGTWLNGRVGWCPGQDVVPWVVDVTQQVKMNQKNTITYHGWFQGTDANPTANPGEIIMYSYLVYYKNSTQVSTTV